MPPKKASTARAAFTARAASPTRAEPHAPSASHLPPAVQAFGERLERARQAARANGGQSSVLPPAPLSTTSRAGVEGAASPTRAESVAPAAHLLPPAALSFEEQMERARRAMRVNGGQSSVLTPAPVFTSSRAGVDGSQETSSSSEDDAYVSKQTTRARVDLSTPQITLPFEFDGGMSSHLTVGTFRQYMAQKKRHEQQTMICIRESTNKRTRQGKDFLSQWNRLDDIYEQYCGEWTSVLTQHKSSSGYWSAIHFQKLDDLTIDEQFRQTRLLNDLMNDDLKAIKQEHAKSQEDCEDFLNKLEFAFTDFIKGERKALNKMVKLDEQFITSATKDIRRRYDDFLLYLGKPYSDHVKSFPIELTDSGDEQPQLKHLAVGGGCNTNPVRGNPARTITPPVDLTQHGIKIFRPQKMRDPKRPAKLLAQPDPKQPAKLLAQPNQPANKVSEPATQNRPVVVQSIPLTLENLQKLLLFQNPGPAAEAVQVKPPAALEKPPAAAPFQPTRPAMARTFQRPPSPSPPPAFPRSPSPSPPPAFQRQASASPPSAWPRPPSPLFGHDGMFTEHDLDTVLHDLGPPVPAPTDTNTAKPGSKKQSKTVSRVVAPRSPKVVMKPDPPSSEEEDEDEDGDDVDFLPDKKSRSNEPRKRVRKILPRPTTVEEKNEIYYFIKYLFEAFQPNDHVFAYELFQEWYFKTYGKETTLNHLILSRRRTLVCKHLVVFKGKKHGWIIPAKHAQIFCYTPPAIQDEALPRVEQEPDALVESPLSPSLSQQGALSDEDL